MDNFEQENNSFNDSLSEKTQQEVQAKKSSVKIIVIGAIVLLCVLAVGAYMWGKTIDDKKQATQERIDAIMQIEKQKKEVVEVSAQKKPTQEDVVLVGEDIEDAASDALKQQSNSDTIIDIEADLNATDLEDLDVPEDLGL